MSEPDTLAGRLRRLREAAGLSQSALARRAGVQRSYVSHLERGQRGARVGWGTVQALAAALGVAVAELAGGPPGD